MGSVDLVRAESEVLAPGQLSLSELAATANREHSAVVQAGLDMVEHAIRAGEALMAARERCEEGGWLKWVENNFQATAFTAAAYMRVAHQQAAVRTSGATTFTGAFLYVRERGLLGPYPPGGAYGKGGVYPEEVRQEAIRLRDEEGLGYKTIARLLGVKRENTVRNWLYPEHARRDMARSYKSRSRRREARRREEELARERKASRIARKAGGARAEAYAMAERMQDVLGRAHREAENRESREAWSLAGEHYRKMRDEIVRALGVS